MNCQYCGSNAAMTTGGCASLSCQQRRNYQGGDPYGQHYYNPNIHNGQLGGMINYDPYSTVLNHILASLLKIEEKLNETK